MFSVRRIITNNCFDKITCGISTEGDKRTCPSDTKVHKRCSMYNNCGNNKHDDIMTCMSCLHNDLQCQGCTVGWYSSPRELQGRGKWERRVEFV